MPPERFSHSSLAAWRRCRYRYYLSYIEDYASKPSVGQMRGTIGHACLGEWYGNGLDDAKAIEKATEVANQLEIESGIDFSNDWDELLLTFHRYFNWARVHDNFETIAIEQEYEIDINGIKLMGFIDGIVKQNNSIWILEHKFLKQASIKHIDLDQQISIYMLAARKLGYDPVGCMYNIIRIGKGGIAVTEPVLRTLAYRNAEGLRVVEYELSNQMLELKTFNEKRHLPVYRNPTKDCHWDCQYYYACISLNDSGEAESVLSRFKKVDREKNIIESGDISDE
jgi:RecB family exonuclease